MGKFTESTGKPCAVCPWRTANQGTRHPGGWYTIANLRRLWAGLRRGERMSCHATDPTNPVPEGYKPVPEGTQTRECAGALVIQQRELYLMQRFFDTGGTLATYRRQRPKGLTREGAIELVADMMVVLPGEVARAKVNLNEAGVGHPDLEWENVHG